MTADLSKEALDALTPAELRSKLRASMMALDAMSHTATYLRTQNEALTARATAAEAARDAAIAGAVRVKPLEWVARYAKYDGGREHFGTGVFGHWYGIKREKNRAWSVSHHIGSKRIEVGFYPDLESAKAAAQADYERRILAALEPNPAEQDREALVAATLERAENEIERLLSDPTEEEQDKLVNAALTDFEHGSRNEAVRLYRGVIHALATHAQTDALAAVRREARAEGMRKAADDYHAMMLDVSLVLKACGFEEFADRVIQASKMVRDAILAAAEKEAGHD